MKLEDIKRMLPIQKHRLDDELEVQSEILYMISEHLAEATSARDRAKDELAKVEANLYLDAKDSDAKVSDTRADAIVKSHPDRRAAATQYQSIRSKQEQWFGLYEAWKQRSYAIKTLADLHIANYFSADGIVSKSDKHEVSREHRAGREALLQTRRTGLTEVTQKRTRRLID